jgi:DNA-binding transcriptional LysR family regulator
VELTQLRTLRAVAETQSFTRAAARLNLTQSAVSQQIKGLEAELGEPLFHRTRGGVSLTRSGQLALAHAGRVLDELDVLRERMRGLGHEPSGRVRAAAATQAFVYHFAPLFESFLRAHPAVELTFHGTISTAQTVTDIAEGAAEVGFASLPVYSPRLQVQPLFEDELVLVAGLGHAIGGGSGDVEVAELEAQRFVLLEPGASIRRATDELFVRIGIRPPLALESNDTAFIKLMVERGLGVSLLPVWAVREEVSAGRLVARYIAGHRLRRSVAVVSRAGFQAAATRSFLDYVIERRHSLQELALGEPEARAPAPRRRARARR